MEVWSFFNIEITPDVTGSNKNIYGYAVSFEFFLWFN